MAFCVPMGDEEPIISLDPLTTRGRWWQFVGLAFIPLVPCIALMIYASVNLSYATRGFSEARAIRHSVMLSTAGLAVVSTLHEEMDGSASIQASGGKEIIDTAAEIYRRTNLKLANFQHWSDLEITRDKFVSDLEDRRQVDQRNLSVIDPDTGNIIDFYEYSVNVFLDWMAKKIDQQNIKISSIQNLFSYYNMLQCSRHVAVVRALGVVALLRGNLSLTEELFFSNSADASITLLNLAEQFTDTRQSLDELGLSISYASNFGLYDHTTGFIPPTGPDLYKAVVWYRRLSNQYFGLIDIVKAEAENFHKSITHEINNRLEYVVTYGIILALLLLGIAPFIIQAARHSVVSLYTYACTMAKKAVEIKQEKRKTENILNDMLPRVISYRLRRGEKIPAEYFESVTVFFSDIEDFLDISRESNPIDIVVFLNDVYNHMDKMLGQGYDTYKVETIGCIYMVVSGLPSRNGNRHASEIARMSLDLMKSTEKFVIPHLPDNTLQMRIGIHTGSAVAGVIGTKMPRYCLFGDTVNTASRLQSSGVARHIHISHSTKDVLDDIGGFESEERGVVAMKGKGTMRTYWLNSRAKRASRGSPALEGSIELNGKSSISSIMEL